MTAPATYAGMFSAHELEHIAAQQPNPRDTEWLKRLAADMRVMGFDRTYTVLDPVAKYEFKRYPIKPAVSL